MAVGAADDLHEKEAEQVVQQVVSTPESEVRPLLSEAGRAPATRPKTAPVLPGPHRPRKNKDEDEEEKHDSHAEPLRLDAVRAGDGSFEASSHVEGMLNLSKGGGNPLPGQVRNYMEPRFGLDFGHVRIHTGHDAESMNEAVGAQAFTHNSDIYYGAGHSPGELALTAHELTHVVQQGGGVRPNSVRRSYPACHAGGTPNPGCAVEQQETLRRSHISAGAGPVSQASTSAATPLYVAQPLVEASAPAGVIYRYPPRDRPPMVFPGDQVFATNPDITLFEQITPVKNHWGVSKKFEPLPSGVFIVDGIPITYGLEGMYAAETNSRLSFGPAILEQIRIIVTGAEAERMRTPRIAPNPWGPILGPPVIQLPPDRTPHGSFAADGMVRFDALAGADASASAELNGHVGLFGALNARAFAGISGGARGDVWSHVLSFVEFRWTDGAVKLSAVLDVTAGLQLAFHLNAYAGVEVELRVPEIPAVTKLTEKVQSWPIIGWFVPNLEHWKWSKRYQKDWPLLNKNYLWQLQQRFVIGESSGSASIEGEGGFNMDNVLADLQAQQKNGDLKDDPEGPGKENRNSDTGAVSAAKAEALAQIGSAKLAAAREKQANVRLLETARKAKAAANASTGSTGAPAVAAASITTGPADPVTALEKRGEKLNDAVASTEQLRKHADELNTPASAPDGVSRNEARSGFEAIATNADKLSHTINKNEDVFAVPSAAEPTDADYKAMNAARIRAVEAFDGCYDVIRTEKLFADDQVREAGTDADLHPYRDAAVAYQGRALAFWKQVEKLESTIELARGMYEKHDHAMGTKVFDEIETKAIMLKDQGETLKKDRPVGDWDKDYVELSGGHLQLQPQYRGKAIRSTFYPHDYSSDTQNRMWNAIVPIRQGEDNKHYWTFPHKKSPRGDFLWLVDDEQERPTLDHTSPTVMAHWNSQGRTTAYPPRKSFYDFEGAALVVVPKTLNSSDGAKYQDSYTPIVTRNFRGSKS